MRTLRLGEFAKLSLVKAEEDLVYVCLVTKPILAHCHTHCFIFTQQFCEVEAFFFLFFLGEKTREYVDDVYGHSV